MTFLDDFGTSRTRLTPYDSKLVWTILRVFIMHEPTGSSLKPIRRLPAHLERPAPQGNPARLSYAPSTSDVTEPVYHEQPELEVLFG